MCVCVCVCVCVFVCVCVPVEYVLCVGESVMRVSEAMTVIYVGECVCVR